MKGDIRKRMLLHENTKLEKKGERESGFIYMIAIVLS
jgi:hypothetical protein